MNKVITASLALFSAALFSAPGYFRVEVPLDRKTSRTLIDLAIENQDQLEGNLKFGEFQMNPSDEINDSSVSCWVWVYRNADVPVKNKDNRIECRWIYGSQSGLGVFSWRMPNSEVRPLKGARDSLSLVIQSDDILPISLILKKQNEEMESEGLLKLRSLDGLRAVTFERNEDRYPELSCQLDGRQCSLRFREGKADHMGANIGASSTVLTKIILESPELSDFVIKSEAELKPSDVSRASCVYNGKQPERGQFSLQSTSGIYCGVSKKGGGEAVVTLDMTNTMVRSWGNRFQGYQAVSVAGLVSEKLYKALRAYAEANDDSLVFVDDLEMLNSYRSVRLRRLDDRVEFPDVGLECTHEVYRDPFTTLFKKYFPEIYKGRVEYFKCLIKGEKN